MRALLLTTIGLCSISACGTSGSDGGGGATGGMAGASGSAGTGGAAGATGGKGGSVGGSSTGGSGGATPGGSGGAAGTAGTAGASSGGASGCGEVGRACTGECASGFACNGGLCVPEGRPGCDGFNPMECPASFPNCLHCVGCDFGDCFTDAELACVCAAEGVDDVYADCP